MLFSTSFDLFQVVLRAVLAVLIGGLIGNERARHGRAAGMRTHMLVCLGAAMTSMTSLYVGQVMGLGGDVFRIPAQVISGIGFLGAGMIVLKHGDLVTGLTTAAGVWTTGTIGIALGYGFYEGALIVTALFLVTIVLFARLEKSKKATEIVYVELDEMYSLNQTVGKIMELLPGSASYRVVASKSGCSSHIGVELILKEHSELPPAHFCELEHVVYAVVEE